MSDVLKVNMLGTFSIQLNDHSIDDRTNRMRKVWLLLAFLIYSRNSHITQDHYLSLLQSSGSEDTSDPNGRLKAMFYRTRAMLNQIDEHAGHNWIVRKNGTYAWNAEIPLVLDVEEFERLCNLASAATDEDSCLDLYLQALALYQGDFLAKLSAEPWVMPLSTYYHQLFLHAAERVLTLFMEREQWEDAISLCEKALKIEPYSETLYKCLMRCCIAVNNRSRAVTLYEEMSELLFSTFGVMPSDESRALYREASREAENLTVPSGTVSEQLREPTAPKGALYCEYDFFKLLYQVQARSIIRSGDVIHIALFSLHGQRGKELPRRSLDRAMDNLQELVLSNLRQGDIVTRCSISQLIIMLPQANYENSCMVCQRLLKAFTRQYPHSPAEIRYSVHPLEPLAPQSHSET